MGDINFEIDGATVLGPMLPAFGLFLAVRMGQDRPGWTGAHAVTRLLTAVYTATVLGLTMFPVVVTHGEFVHRTPWTDQVSYVPVLSADVGTAANAAMMIPLGMLLPLLYCGASSPARVTALTAATGLTIEVSQLGMYIVAGNARSVDIDDVLANTLGGLVGYLILAAATRVPATARLLGTLALPGSALATREQRRARPDTRPTAEATVVETTVVETTVTRLPRTVGHTAR